VPRITSLYNIDERAFTPLYGEILDDLISMGLNVYQTFQPEIYDMRVYKEKLKNRLTIWGGISTQAHLLFLSPEEIYRITKDAISILGEGGGYIASPTHDAPGDKNVEFSCRLCQLELFGCLRRQP